MSPQKAARAARAKERQEAYNALTTQEKIARLDSVFGKGKGATKVRAKLANAK